uniref:Uncharacterized protein n=1 Tax=Oryza barthii TaxID=65489 RepID=A0A0D3H745_9ORYZ
MKKAMLPNHSLDIISIGIPNVENQLCLKVPVGFIEIFHSHQNAGTCHFAHQRLQVENHTNIQCIFSTPSDILSNSQTEEQEEDCSPSSCSLHPHAVLVDVLLVTECMVL